MHEAVTSMMDEAQEKFDEQIEVYENISKQLEHNISVINLLTDENDYRSLKNPYNLERQNRQEELDFYTRQKDYWKFYLEHLEKGTDEWEKAKEKYNEAAEAWADALETAITAARTEFENNIKIIFQDLNNLLTYNKGLDYINTQ